MRMQVPGDGQRDTRLERKGLNSGSLFPDADEYSLTIDTRECRLTMRTVRAVILTAPSARGELSTFTRPRNDTMPRGTTIVPVGVDYRSLTEAAYFCPRFNRTTHRGTFVRSRRRV